MIKKLIVFASIIVSLNSWAQDNTASPYSYYGLGEVKFRGTQDARAMGGLSITGDSIQLGLMNPASYSKLKLTTFAVGGTNSSTNFSTDTEKEKAQRTSFDYLAVGLPLGKFGMAFGLMPYSAVGYKNENTVESTEGTRYFRSQGNGFINKVFVGGSYTFNDNLSFGFDFAYHFGDIINEFTEKALSPELTQYTTREKNTTELNGVSFNIGLLYNRQINSKLTFHSSLTYSPESKLSTTNFRNIATVVYTIDGTELSNDDEDINLPNKELTIPSRLSLGFGLGENKKWLLGSELTFTQNKNLVNRFTELTQVSYENSTRFALGGYYIPKYDSFSNYLQRIVYRAGFKYENTGLVLNNKSINDYGMNFGLGLPLGFSRIDLGFEFGKRGTTSNGLIEENYFNISVGLNLGAKWFERRKID
ncbi:long-subunit fatty acid transport protein [Flavobacterium aquaticum]|uniref:Long-subunit fatty acid transport protein n=1 Tax=Flavobacterium aquaticum TaxID=1236486 RepID=A0A327YMQ9_9FLAO|nr:outer membrane protein transport protein [Flavobacterium aquaticum]RAK20985.1 long-subunit fatty acid transport protein [Flavobacterium aquaticum]